MHQLTTKEQVDELFTKQLAIIFKHSTICPVSSAAKSQVELYLKNHLGAPIYIVDVIADRAISNYIAEKTEVQHESPQIILLKAGTVSWNTSHSGIRADALAEKASF